MKIKVLQENLSQALNYLQKAIPGKPQLPILASVHMKVMENGCQLSATDLYFGVRSNFQADISKNGELVIPGKEFKEIINSLPPGQIELSYSDNLLSINSKAAKAKIQCMDSGDYPDFPESGGDEYLINAESLDLITKQVLFSASTDQARPVLTTVLFSLEKDQENVVSTDGFRLSVLSGNGLFTKKDDKKTKGGEKFLIPSKYLGEVSRIQKMVESSAVNFSISNEMKQAVFNISDVEVFVRLIEGEYPPYQKIIPAEFKTTILLDRLELLDNIKRAVIFAREASNIIKFSFNPNERGQLEILASSPSIGEFRGVLENAKVEGDKVFIAFNAKYILEFLNSMSVDKIWFGVSESLKPAMFRPEGQDEYQYVVMPFKVSE